MGIADSMKNITEGIITSYDMRVEALGNLVADTRETLKEFRLDRKKMSKELKSNLAKGEEDRLKDFKALMGEIKKFVGGVVKETAALLKKLQEEYKDMADELKDSLAKGETERLKAFKGMMKDTLKGIEDIETYVANKLKEFSDAHAE